MSNTAIICGAMEMVLQPGYPKITAEEDNITVSLQYMVEKGRLRDLPDLGDPYRGELPRGSGVEKVVLTRMTCTPKTPDGPWLVDLEYGPEPLYDETRKGVRKTYELSTEDMDVPLAQHPDYKMKWDHVLLSKGGSSVPSFWRSATSASGTGESYMWAKPGDVIPEGWKVIAAETKPGVESYRSGVARVTLVKTCRSRSALQAEARSQDYTIGRPGTTFGYRGDWLRGGSSIKRNGRRWELTVDYLNSSRIDRDLYHG